MAMDAEDEEELMRALAVAERLEEAGFKHDVIDQARELVAELSSKVSQCPGHNTP